MPKVEVDIPESELQKLRCNNNNSPVKIVILQRGWVFVGRFKQTGSNCILENAHCIRVWGTTKGLGELINCPLKNTVLDPSGTVRFHELTVVAMIDCNEIGWSKIC